MQHNLKNSAFVLALKEMHCKIKYWINDSEKVHKNIPVPLI